jgi:P4 family phage/plasmid primase-like protien
MSTRKYSVYTKKENAIKKLTGSQILANRDITKYFIVSDHQELLTVIKKSKIKSFYEYIPNDKPVNLFFDIEIYKDKSEYYTNYLNLLQLVNDKVSEYFKTSCYTVKRIVLESHAPQVKVSFHLIYKITDDQNKEVLFNCVADLKSFYKLLGFDTYKDSDNKYLIDPSVYRAGLFRTIYSSKNEIPIRPLVKSDLSDDFSELDTFVCYHQESHILYNLPVNDAVIDVTDEIANVPEALESNDKSIIKKYVQKQYHHPPTRVRDIFVDQTKNCIVIALTEKFCNFVEREHNSNNQYIIIDTHSSKQKCHDPEIRCSESKHNEVKMEDYPKEINQIIKKCLKVNKRELDLIDHAMEECKSYITENFDNKIEKMQFDKNELIFRADVSDNSLIRMNGKCTSCKVEHQISNTGYCMRCIVCKSIFPKNQLIPVDERYKNLNNFWMNYTNNGTINNIVNIYQGEDDFSCDVQLDNTIFKNKDLTKLYNQVLDGHKITKLAEVIYFINKDFVYTKNNWYYFNGSIWKLDDDNLSMKKTILDSTSNFNKINHHYEHKQTNGNSMQLIKNIKNLVNKLNKPGFKDDIIKEAKMFFNDPDFMGKLNSKKHLLPFTNGVFDLLTNQFRPTTKEDYINLTVNYDYTPNENPEVHKFINEVLPNQAVRDYVLKKMSECLNGDIPNTYFLMFIGDSGANGKSQLLNLMKLAMGEFGEKVEVTLLTRKRNNANEANSEKIKLLHKRFAFLSEPEDGEKINIGLLKELTGSEEIVARGLYQDALSFVMEAKLFLACNELPEIKGEDQALWRRIRVIDFPSKFVDEPSGPGEYKIDRTLPSRMREDISWRQTFIKILLNYYTRDIKEPDEVKMKTNEYRQENNELFSWLDENIEYQEGSILHTTDLYSAQDNKLSNNKKGKLRKQVEKWIKEKYPNVKCEYQDTSYDNIKYKGWLHLHIKNC